MRPGATIFPMRLRILAFASATDAIGASTSELDLAEGATVGDLRRELVARYPALGGVLSRSAIAVGGEIAEVGQRLAEGLEVAILPPVSGG